MNVVHSYVLSAVDNTDWVTEAYNSVMLIFLPSFTLCITMPSEKEIRSFVNPKIFMRISSINKSQIYPCTL